jgi:putative endonuclease
MADKAHRQKIGQWGEQVALDYLIDNGLQLVARNVRTPYGELDLVMMDALGLVVVEVKARTSSAFGLPEEAITARKREHLIQTRPGLPDSWRIDVIAIRGKPAGPDPEIVWFQNAVV